MREWRLPSGAAEDRNMAYARENGPEARVAVAVKGDRGSQHSAVFAPDGGRVRRSLSGATEDRTPQRPAADHAGHQVAVALGEAENHNVRRRSVRYVEVVVALWGDQGSQPQVGDRLRRRQPGWRPSFGATEDRNISTLTSGMALLMLAVAF
ncbi:hypothetical protein GCM10022232_58850 [Streptomyces plumbiresistens]|uniref:Uncharacterized protein n=1 Tax=Streptomyces plumbiresistens TaxID=511811 RepID=A0ABP7SD86_9ACTN